MPTDWALVAKAHADSGPAAMEARRTLVEPYLRPAWKYLLSATRDPDKSDDLLGEFCLRFMKGAFHRANSSQGELGLMVKTALRRLVIDARAKDQQNRSVLSIEGLHGLGDQLTDKRSSSLESFQSQHWLLEMAMERLRQEEENNPDCWDFTVLRLRLLYPEDTSKEMAVVLSALMERPLSPNAVRIMMHKAITRLRHEMGMVEAISKEAVCQRMLTTRVGAEAEI